MKPAKEHIDYIIYGINIALNNLKRPYLVFNIHGIPLQGGLNTNSDVTKRPSMF